MKSKKRNAGVGSTGAQRRKITATIGILSILLLASSAESQTLFKQLDLNNKKNDTITVSVRLLSTDPDENLETREGLRVVSSDGSLDQSIFKRWGTDETFPAFKAQAGDITIWCYGVGDDGDEGCNLAATINGHPAYTPEMKQTAKRMTLGLGMAGAVMLSSMPVICPAGPLGVVGCVMIGSTAGTLGAMAYLTSYVAGDPARGDYWVIAEPVFGSVPNFTTSMGITTSQRDAANTMLEYFRIMYGYMKASTISADRSVGAHEAGAFDWEQVQLDYSAHYARAAAPYAWALRDALYNVAQYWHYTAFNVDQNQLLRDARYAMWDANSLHRRELDRFLVGLGIPWEDHQQIIMQLSLAAFPVVEPGCLDCADVPSKDGFASLYWVVDRLGDLAWQMQNTYSPRVASDTIDLGDNSSAQWLAYLATYSDLLNAFGWNWPAARQHWYQYGQYEGRYGWFEYRRVCQAAKDWYYSVYPDVAAAGVDAWTHFSTDHWGSGFWEGRYWNGGICQ